MSAAPMPAEARSISVRAVIPAIAGISEGVRIDGAVVPRLATHMQFVAQDQGGIADN
ncbi:hypothetical protein [Asticcacaulis sp.]|uniref:hypothetical protein n=1 Tax=Asticcacaulis sp. TaxID=1872648 RepID=UPI002C4E2CEE|nr:hypothetical protein [Asticcacaulis sp.]HTM82209.1 hypothetical protein [Asticcacaulis sp.]